MAGKLRAPYHILYCKPGRSGRFCIISNVFCKTSVFVMCKTNVFPVFFPPFYVVFCVCAQDALLDDVMLGFRLKEGLDLDTLADKYGHDAASRVEEGAKEGLTRGWVLHDGKDACRGGVAGGHDGGRSSSDRSNSKPLKSGTNTVNSSGSEITSSSYSRSVSAGVGVAVVGGDVEVGTGEESVASGANGGGSRQQGEGDGEGKGSRGRLHLSDPDGFLFSNSVISSVFCELDEWQSGKDRRSRMGERRRRGGRGEGEPS